MTPITLPSGKYLIVDVPEFSMRHIIATDKILYRFDNGSWGKITLPPGSYTLIGADPLNLTEDEADKIVEKRSNGISYKGYTNFACTNSSVDSLRSLLTANGHKPGSAVILKVND